MFNKIKSIALISLLSFGGLFFSYSCDKKNPSEELAAKRAKLRAYVGAPPVIPHPVMKNTTHYCLTCHLDGKVFDKNAEIWGKKNVVAKITPHPTYLNCLQCHVPQHIVWPFHKNKFKTFHLAHAVKIVKTEEEGNPPQRPHQDENRENCIVCHLSKTADPTLVPKHGMREYCEACHVPPESLNIYAADGE